MACMTGCREWWCKETLEGLLSWDALEASEPDVPSLLGWPFPPVPMPDLRHHHGGQRPHAVVFDHCSAHGVWLDRNERDRFARAFGIRPQLLES